MKPFMYDLIEIIFKTPAIVKWTGVRLRGQILVQFAGACGIISEPTHGWCLHNGSTQQNECVLNIWEVRNFIFRFGIIQSGQSIFHRLLDDEEHLAAGIFENHFLLSIPSVLQQV